MPPSHSTTSFGTIRALARSYRPAVASFLRWWVAELYALLPSRLRPDRDRLILDLRDGVIHASLESGKSLGCFPLAGPAAEAPARREIPAVLRLPPEEVLQRELLLPAVAEENLRQVLAFEMDRATPFKAEQVCYDGEVVERIPSSRQIRVRLTMVPRSFLDDILEQLEMKGIRPDVVDAKEISQAVGPSWTNPVNLLPAERRPKSRARLSPVNATLAVLALILLGAAVLLPLSNQRIQAIALQQAADAVRQEALAAENLRAEVERLEQRARFLVERKQEAPLAIGVLNELARLLPDDTWVANLTLGRGTIVIQGESPTASDLIGIVESSPLFAGAEFRSPVTINPASAMQRFQIGATVSGREGL